MICIFDKRMVQLWPMRKNPLASWNDASCAYELACARGSQEEGRPKGKVPGVGMSFASLVALPHHLIILLYCLLCTY